ncbi:WxL domain-containing protein [Candidatus Enterococcus murrayae]|uniref:WxL domain-containing protein n=1 Tax=Candidatus Enterococcus murrayae TaxID=2815321 RepID=A0ABS3HF02_9ENTE|nr:WxL domain-containing protein [Enterococcus sp. MJM16]MBO0451823.1 WxL domain-containing protein [Enterococcus sp. MJM16]
MSKRVKYLLLVGLLLSQFSNFPFVSAETMTSEISSTLSSVADDPRTQSSSNESTSIKSIEQKVETDTSEMPESDLPEADSRSSETSPKEKTNDAESIRPQAGKTLIEGVDIDADFAEILRTGADLREPQYGQWSGDDKGKDQLTVEDMEELTYVNISFFHRNVQSLKGIEYAVNLERLEFIGNKIISLDLRAQTKLMYLAVRESTLEKVDISNSLLLETIFLDRNQLTDVKMPPAFPRLKQLYLNANQLTSLEMVEAPIMETLWCYDNQLTSLDVTKATKLGGLYCWNNQLTSLDVTNNPYMTIMVCYDNELTSLDVSNMPKLKKLWCMNNRISDITSAYGLTQLKDFDASDQRLQFGVPINQSGKMIVDLLKTSAHAGLSVVNQTIGGSPIFTISGDVIEMSNIVYDDVDGNSLAFEYDPDQLTEGTTPIVTKQFSGTITFVSVSDLKNQLKPEKQRLTSGEEVTWTWTMESFGNIPAEQIYANLELPSGLTLVPGSVTLDGNSVSDNIVNGTTTVSDLAPGDSHLITFKTICQGNAEEWLEAIGKLTWGPPANANQSKGAVQILDDEQVELPDEPSNDMELLSVPLSFRYGIWGVENTAQVIPLQSSLYQTNTNVVTSGFYTRLRDDRTISTGWKLTAQLSDFSDTSNEAMPNGAGAALYMENMKLESVLNRGSQQEAIDPSPTGVPSNFSANTILDAGSTATTLVSASSGEGNGTWQVRVPFDKVTLHLPPNAGKRGKHYTAKLTWSLDDTL